MIVKNIIVNGKELFIDLLIRNLIKNEISYTLVDDYELHYDGHIYRFYNPDEILDHDEVKIDNFDVFEMLPEFYLNNETVCYKNIDLRKEDKPKINKKILKYDNRKNLNILKNSR